MYYPGIDSAQLERTVLVVGKYVRPAKRATVVKILEFNADVGASEGSPTNCVQVECTNGVYHGRPITKALYETKLAKEVPCCDLGVRS